MTLLCNAIFLLQRTKNVLYAFNPAAGSPAGDRIQTDRVAAGLTSGASRFAEGGGSLSAKPPSQNKGCAMAEIAPVHRKPSRSRSPPAPRAVRDAQVRNAEVRDAEDRSPAAFREFAEKGIAQAKDNYEKMKSAAEEATDMLEETYATASKGCRRLRPQGDRDRARQQQRGVRSVRRIDDARSPIPRWSSFRPPIMREQFDTVTAQAKELTELAQKVATETAEPIKESITTPFNKAA